MNPSPNPRSTFGPGPPTEDATIPVTRGRHARLAGRLARRSLPLALALLAAASASALDPRAALTQFGLEVWQSRQGLFPSSVSALAQTKDGYLWIGTEEGLVRFDGVRFRVFDRHNTPALARQAITCLEAARDGSLWIGTFGGGLLRLKRGRFTSWTIHQGLPEDAVTALAEEGDGTLWIGTVSQGVARMRAGALLPPPPALGSSEVRALYRDAEGAMWIGTRSGVERVVGGHVSIWTTREGLSSDQVTALTGDASGAIWIATRSGLNRYRAGRLRAFGPGNGLTAEDLAALTVDRDGNLWVGSAGGGIYRFAAGRFSSLSRKAGLAGNDVHALLEDRDGNLWVGCSGGLSRLRPGPFLVTSTAEGLSDDDVRPILEDRGGTLWVGTAGGGLNAFRGGAWRALSARDGLLSDRISSLYEDRRGTLWIGTSRGLDRYERGRLTGYTTRDGLSHNVVMAITSDSSGSLWVGTAGGLDRLDGGRFTAYGRREGLTSERISSLAAAPDGSLWVGTMGGGVHRIVAGRVVPVTQGRLDRAFVTALLSEPDGTLWVGTSGDGLFRWKSGRWSEFTSADGLFDDVVLTVLDDGRGYLWSTSRRGVWRVPKAELERFAAGDRRRIRSQSYDATDGLKESECSGGFQPASLKARDGRLYFATVKGLAVVDPARLAPSEPPPRVLVEETVVDDTVIPAGALTGLPPAPDRIEFHYTAFALVPERVRFRFKLEGYDRDWIDAGSGRVATYTNLPPGSYRFLVQAENRDGAAGQAGVALSLSPRFYAAPWLVGLVGVAFLSAAAYAHRARVRQVELATELETARLQALRAQLQPHFLFNTLNTILPLIYRDPRAAARTLVQLGELLRRSLEGDATRPVPLSDELDFLRKYLDIQLVRFQSRFTTHFDVDEDVLDAAVPNLLFQPLVENAIKHGISKHRGPGRLEVSCKRHGDRLRIRVWNTSGADPSGPADHSHGIGLSNIEERLNVLFGTRHGFERKPVPGGFEVSIELPLSRPPRRAADGPPQTGARESA
jgi:ligand-binding sensor domain-containing protein